MDLPENSNGTDKSWDHPWSTEEMRQHRNNWSLAADAGLLKHLEQFSNNLTETVNKTQEKLNSLTDRLNETSVIIDNVTNASLALANTQFIESRVHEDDVDTKPPQSTEGQKSNNEELNQDDLLASVSESIKQGLSIMDEKFERLEVPASDSEDDGEIPTPSIVLKPKDPYKHRPLPYVIGSEAWEGSTRVGLEWSSSDSEAPDGEPESASEDENIMPQRAPNVNNLHEPPLRRTSSSSSVSTDLNGRGSTVKNYSNVSSRTEKLEARSQDTLNSGSEIATPSVGPTRAENSTKEAPSFAEELAARLGKVLPSRGAATDTQDADQSSINRYKDDLFAPDDGDVFGPPADNLFSDTSNLFDAEVSNSLWKDKPIRVPKTNMIPPSFDVPPPMNEVEKPKSAFDDLCGDADSEDSDDIFAPKSSSKTTVTKPVYPSVDNREHEDSKENKFLKIVQGKSAANMATSTPETNDNGGLFGDETDDDDDELFGSAVKSRNRISQRSPETARAITRPKQPGLAITRADILSSELGNRLFQHAQRQDSSDSSDVDASKSNDNAASVSRPINPDGIQNSGSSLQNNSEPSSIVAGNASGSRVNVVDSSASSGISIQPNNSNNTFGVALGAEFQPQLESTRLKSEDLHRERITSDSLFGSRVRQPENASSLNTDSSVRPHDARIAEGLDSHQEIEDFDSDDVFGPPPLPKADSKSKSDASSVDELFSNASSGSRSRKSSDLLAASEPQYDVKTTSGRSGGLFDEDVDIFGTGDAPDVDIFGEDFASSLPSRDAKSSGSKFEKNSQDASFKTIDLFGASTTDAGDFAVTRSSVTKPERKTNSIFDDSEDDDDDDLFGSNFLKNDRKPFAMPRTNDDDLFADKSKSAVVESVPTETKKDLSSGTAADQAVERANKTKLDDKRDSDEAAVVNPVPSYPSDGLFDNLDDDDDDDSLFDSKKNVGSTMKSSRNAVEEAKSTVSSEEAAASKTEESKFKMNCAKIEGLLKERSVSESGEKKSDEKDERPSVAEKPPLSAKSPELMAMKKELDQTSRKATKIENEIEVSTTDGGKISKARNTAEVAGGETAKRDPPKTLSIRLPMPSAGDDSAQAPRRAVSGKIKNLMGKMGDLKILSPTDTPPLWRKAEEKSDDEPTESRDSEDGSLISVPSKKSPTIVANRDEDPSIFPEVSKDEPVSPQDDSGNSETAVSFDVPAQVETLTVTASKSRARIQAKRRPQSRHARHSALRKSGIDFDTVDATGPEAGESDPSDNTFSSISDKIPTVITDSVDSPKNETSSERLDAPEVGIETRTADKPAESSASLAPDDRSELSFSKGSSMSINKNTLLSPSTDEEDLFDVPPDLPEDPPKEDTLFGRAPILSPIDALLGSKNTKTKERSKDSRAGLAAPEAPLRAVEDPKPTKSEKVPKDTLTEKNSNAPDISERSKSDDEKTIKPTDPLRDNSHDPLKDPSQLFAFVTKTPSPEKGQNLLFKEDDSLFTRLAKKSAEEAKAASKKPTLDLFDDDSSGDLFSGKLAKTAKKPATAAKNRLFDDEDTDDDGAGDLFGSGTRAKATRDKIETVDDPTTSKSSETSGLATPSRESIFGDDADDDLFVDALDKKFSPEPEKSSSEIVQEKLFPATSRVAKDAKLDDIFGDQSSGEDDIFATKKPIGKSRPPGSIFDTAADDDDVNDIFGKKSSTKRASVETSESRPTTKKSVTRDLKKTAEKIVEDPLSMLQDD